MCLNHSETIPTYPVQGKIVSRETSLWSQKGWGLLLYSTFDHSLWSCMWELLFKDSTRKYCRTNNVIQENCWTQSQPTNELHFCMLKVNNLKFRFHLRWHQKDKIPRRKLTKKVKTWKLRTNYKKWLKLKTQINGKKPHVHRLEDCHYSVHTAKSSPQSAISLSLCVFLAEIEIFI